MTDSVDWVLGYMQGVADAGARLVGAVAAELGPDHPLIDRMVIRLGDLSIELPVDEDEVEEDDGVERLGRRPVADVDLLGRALADERTYGEAES